MAQSHELSSGRTVTNRELGLFLQRGAVEATLGGGDFLERLEELKALPLKEQRWCLKNEVFKLIITTTLS